MRTNDMNTTGTGGDADDDRRARRGKAKGHGVFGPRWIGVCTLALFAGMLIWSKLRIASSVPRSAYADPKETDAGERGAAPSVEKVPEDAAAAPLEPARD